MSKETQQAKSKRQRKSTNAQMQERIEQLAHVLGQRRLNNGEIKRFCAAQWGLKFRQAAEYAARARTHLIKLSNRPKEEWRSEALDLYESIVKDPKTTVQNKLAAQSEINAIIGNYAPKNFRVGDPDGKPMQSVVAPVVNFILPDNHRTPGKMGTPGGNGHSEMVNVGNNGNGNGARH